jgi:glycosidase
MDFILSDALLTVFNEDGNWESGMAKVYNNFANDFLFPNVNNLLIFAENHDTQRINHVYQNDIGKYKMTMALLATVRGIPQLYYGSEIGMAGNKDDGGDAAIRQDFPGGWEGDAINAFTAAGRTQGQNDYFDFTSKLFNWRKTKPVLHSGKMTHYIPEDNTYVYFRYNSSESVMVLFNNSSEIKTLKTNRFAENLGNYKTGKDIINDKIIDLTSEITMEPKSVLILELK